jgi:hypothetical protein
VGISRRRSHSTLRLTRRRSDKVTGRRTTVSYSTNLGDSEDYPDIVKSAEACPDSKGCGTRLLEQYDTMSHLVEEQEKINKRASTAVAQKNLTGYAGLIVRHPFETFTVSLRRVTIKLGNTIRERG